MRDSSKVVDRLNIRPVLPLVLMLSSASRAVASGTVTYPHLTLPTNREGWNLVVGVFLKQNDRHSCYRIKCQDHKINHNYSFNVRTHTQPIIQHKPTIPAFS